MSRVVVNRIRIFRKKRGSQCKGFPTGKTADLSIRIRVVNSCRPSTLTYNIYRHNVRGGGCFFWAAGTLLVPMANKIPAIPKKGLSLKYSVIRKFLQTGIRIFEDSFLDASKTCKPPRLLKVYDLEGLPSFRFAPFRLLSRKNQFITGGFNE